MEEETWGHLEVIEVDAVAAIAEEDMKITPCLHEGVEAIVRLAEAASTLVEAEEDTVRHPEELTPPEV